ncbi:MAG: zinc dependent phospholipase C family protein [Candidatus Nanoarchaeia archaeon]
MRKLKISIICLLFLVLLSPGSLAYGPHFHNYITNQLKEQGQEIEIIKDCLDGGINEEAFRAGSIVPDITVIYYFTEGGKNYKATHNWNFQQELLSQANTEDEKCFAYGVAAHLLEDSIAHTDNIPKKIESTRVPNWILHPLLEKKYDSELALKRPEIVNQSIHMMDALVYGDKRDRYIQMIQNTLGENTDIDVKMNVDRLAAFTGSFYKEGFRPPENRSIFSLYKYIDSLTNFLHPYIVTGTVGDLDLYVDKNIQTGLNVFRNWGAQYLYTSSPHGFSELEKADREASWLIPLILLLLIAISVTIPILLMVWRRNFWYSLLFLLIIPIILISIAVIYVLL